MTRAASLRAGLADAWSRPKLVATVWAWNLLLAVAATLPLSRWLRAALPQSPEADLLAHRFSFGLMFELSQNAGPAMALVWAAVSGALVLGFLAGPLLAGGILEVLGSGDDRPFFHRFFRGGGHFYGRFLRLSLFATALAVVVAGVVAAVLGAVLRPLRESSWEPGELLSHGLVGAAVVAVLAVFWLVLDYARVQVSRDDSRRMWRALMSGLHFTLHFRGRTLGLLARTWLLLLVLGAAYLLFRAGVPSHTAALIALLFLVQQAFMLARTGLRIAQVSAERQMHLALRPAVGATPMVVTSPPAAVPVLDAPAPVAAPALDVAPELRVDQG
jgi:hypothetical protein